ncbi:MAG TPA: CHAD domain-containing protein [Candidatus Polarisedimenticolia bacterium]|nr:CHAD domain-containing protein [Candidatus Polarisedimenticolia bacterium]
MAKSGNARSILAGHARAVLRQRKEAVLTGRVEAVHQLRVATRRLQETLSFLEPFLPGRPVKRLNRRARKVRRSLGSLRNADVLVELVHELRSSLPPARREGLEPLAARLKREASALRRRARGRKGLRVAPISRRIDALLRCLPSGLEAPLASRGEEVIAMRLRKVRQALPKARRGGAEALHELRIKIKRYRYALEILDLAGIKTARPAIERARSLQTALGKLHDVDVLIELVKRSDPAMNRMFHAMLRGRRRQRLRDVEKLLKDPGAFLLERKAA